MEIKIVPIDSIAFFVTDTNSIERVKVKSYSITSIGGKYEVETKDGKIITVESSELYEKSEDIKIVKFNDFFYLDPILESDGLNGRGFPWTKRTYTYFAIYKVKELQKINLINDNEVNLTANIIPFGIIESKFIKDLKIPITDIKKGSHFLEDNSLHLKTIIEFNKNINMLFKKITYKYINMNSTSCKLVNGGGFAFDPNSSEPKMEWIKYNLDIEEIILRSPELDIKNIFPNVTNFNSYRFDDNKIDKNEKYSLGIINDKKSKIKLITKDPTFIPKVINYKSINISCIFEKEKEFEILKGSKLLPTLIVWDIKFIDAKYGLEAINRLTEENQKASEIIKKLNKKKEKENG